MYNHVAQLHRNGRVFPIRGDLRKDKAIRSVSRAAKQANLPIRALYFSNAEQYFRYAEPFQENIDTLFSDEKSLVLRTKPKGKKDTNSDDYWYYIRPSIISERTCLTTSVQRCTDCSDTAQRLRVLRVERILSTRKYVPASERSSARGPPEISRLILGAWTSLHWLLIQGGRLLDQLFIHHSMDECPEMISPGSLVRLAPPI